MEVVWISQSTRANYVTTHLYNGQESHIPYKKGEISEFDNHTFMDTTPLASSVTYSPRAMLVDFRDNWGSLNKFEYFDRGDGSDVVAVGSTPDHFRRHFPEKHPYQVSLDQGTTTEGKLNSGNVKYWSDFNKLIYNPRQLISVPDYVSDPERPGRGIHRYFAKNRFDAYHKGVEQYQQTRDDADDAFRHMLESCDSFQGLQVASEVDSSWGGFTSALTTDVVDEYFNNNNKVTLWTWDMSSSDLRLDPLTRISKIRSAVEHISVSSLVFRVEPHWKLEQLGAAFDPQSLWHSSAIVSAWINGIWGVINKSSRPTSMSNLEDAVTKGTKRNVINRLAMDISKETESNTGGVDLNGLSSMPMDVDLSTFTAAPVAENKATSTTVELGINQGKAKTVYSSNYINNDVEGANCYTHPNLNEMTKIDSFPQGVLSSINWLEFSSTSELSVGLKQDRVFLQRSRGYPGIDLEVDDTGELIEQLSAIIDEYSDGNDDSDDDWDD
ncbi:hypothetical protein DIURU_003276 [Diutina rugosa]|uniref:Protein DML1 n=1 Tax=Diutina rugosa TaxID=5481 RepID=A0A642UQX6_DIURU|nr:uncharacterized protein DIURU_003276 [Diutina rugosa]KAA8901331.1 hypothetical protein DIURU_003276 [Diutina rugosa]